MKQGAKISERQRDDLARTLLRAGRDTDPSPDGVFLAGFRDKLRRAEQGSPAAGGSFGELCWRAVPALGAIAAAALLASAFALSGARPEGGVYEERVMWSLTSSGPTDEIGDDLILSAALLEPETLQ